MLQGLSPWAEALWSFREIGAALLPEHTGLAEIFARDRVL